ncbi:unnamed protein product [Cyclocybe aegerita]|uniref:P-loop containing nucleoside triphosphate hydrolase protein n=1 Tax=Cyclocybe aegerita TaxID=1973307 RepID=A0A8S0W4K5_CYCAE|nr:unnamed protein product [Cyclocybe aegerita]
MANDLPVYTAAPPPRIPPTRVTRGYQLEMLEESLRRNIIIALDTGSGKTHIAVLRLKHEIEREPRKLAWFFAPTVALCEQQKTVIKFQIPVSVGIVSGANEPDQWKNAALWERVLRTHRIMVSTPQVFLDALRHGYILLGRDISLLVFDEAHHAADKHPYNRIMAEFYFDLPPRTETNLAEDVRPMVLGLTASPIYGGNVEKAFKTIESNLDSTIRAPRRNREELAQYVHRPIFKHVMYIRSEDGFSTNLAALSAVLETMNIENDPYVKSLRSQLSRAGPGSPEYRRIDQKLSKVIEKESSFTHKGLRDFERAASDICSDLGPWSADWFVWQVLERAKKAANPYDNMMVTWKPTEKRYLLDILNRIVVSPVSYYPDDIADDCSNKTEVLIECLLNEKATAESLNDSYTGIIFVQRRDAVIALAELLKNHPATKGIFSIGVLLGTSDSRHRHSMMDITRNMVEPQEDTIAEFKARVKNLIISTAVAEEGIDIQECNSVIRWDPPPNMASWTQSRGRARKQRSTFTVMFEAGGRGQEDVAKWENLEKQMVAQYNDPRRDLALLDDNSPAEDDVEDDELQFMVPSTGALLTLHSAVAHLEHFCAVIPNSTHVDNRPVYDLDPPEFPEGWHAFDSHLKSKPPCAGPFGSTVTLPRALPLPERQFTVDRIYQNKTSAHRHAAFKAYKALYDAGLLNENLLPITSVMKPELEDEVKAMLADVEKREGLAKVALSIDPWRPDESAADLWFCSVLTLEGLPPLMLFTRREMVPLEMGEGPLLYRSGVASTRTSVHPLGKAPLDDKTIPYAREYTRTVFWGLNNSRMDWDDLDFSYLFLPIENIAGDGWEERRAWFAREAAANPERHRHHLMVRADEFGNKFGYPNDLTFIQRHMGSGRPFKFVAWRHDPLSEEEEAELREEYEKHLEEVEITYPLLAVRAYPPRTNLLIPIKPRDPDEDGPAEAPIIYLLPQHSGVVLLSPHDSEYGFLLPSVLRSLSMTLTAVSLRNTLFSETRIAEIPIPLLTIAVTAPVSGERLNYQRLETLGDTVLKFIAGIQLFTEYPLWHEGYLTRKKDHAVSNVRLAKEDIKRGLYRWIIRDTMLGKKWKPQYFTTKKVVEPPPSSPTSPTSPSHIESMPIVESPAPSPSAADSPSQERNGTTEQKKKPKPKKVKAKGSQKLSTKVLADVVESIIGAAYFHGGFELGYECLKYFDLGLKWEPLSDRIAQVLSRVDAASYDPSGAEFVFPPQLNDVERMLNYTFKRKILLIEALTHASYQSDSRTPSYERMEFLGDSVLDMIVTDYLYRAPGKNYSPGHMHLRKSAVVNGHLLAYICLKTSTTLAASIPRPNASGAIEETDDSQEIYLYKCLLHSSGKVLEDQLNAFTRFRLRRPEIEESLAEGIFPWAALTKMQAPKFFSDMIESLLGAILLDSGGSVDVVRGVITHLGIMTILEHIVNADVDVLHPVSRLSLWAQKNGREIAYDSRKEGGHAVCSVLVDGVKEVEVSDEWRGKPSQEEVKFTAAEKAIKAFRLRDVGVEYELLKKKRKPSSKSRKKQRAKEEGDAAAA